MSSPLPFWRLTVVISNLLLLIHWPFVHPAAVRMDGVVQVHRPWIPIFNSSSLGSPRNFSISTCQRIQCYNSTWKSVWWLIICVPGFRIIWLSWLPLSAFQGSAYTYWLANSGSIWVPECYLSILGHWLYITSFPRWFTFFSWFIFHACWATTEFAVRVPDLMRSPFPLILHKKTVVYRRWIPGGWNGGVCASSHRLPHCAPLHLVYSAMIWSVVLYDLHQLS